MHTKRINALAQYLGVDKNELESTAFDSKVISFGNEEYAVLTDKEATERAEESIEQTLFGFNTDFLAGYTKVGDKALKAIQEMYEDGNEAIKELIGSRWKSFVDDAISTDGRGHFISSYDGEENEKMADGVRFYIYRLN